MSWTNHLGNKLPIESIYKIAPALTNVRLHEVRLHQDGARLSVRFDLNDFPESPPSKWIAGKYNRAQLTLMLIDVSDFQMCGWSPDNVGDLSIQECDGGVRMGFLGHSSRIDSRGRFLEVEAIVGYFDSEIAATGA